MNAVATDKMHPIVEIRDPMLDGERIAQRVSQRVAQRRAEGAYDLDPTAVGPVSLRPADRAVAEDTIGGMVDFPGIRESLAELIARAHLHEPDFASSAPVIAPLVVAVRRMWNWMSTKWYMRPVLRQQSNVNARAARIISDLAQWHELDARRLQQLESRVAELEARLARIEAEAKR
jgi:hypothetical protein